MTQKFTTSISNKIYYGIAALGFCVVFIMYSDKTSEEIGRLIGQLLVSWLLPLLFAWLIWRLFGKSKAAASMTFNILLTLLLLGQVKQGLDLDNIHIAQALQEVHVELQEYRQALANAESSEARDQAAEAYAEAYIARLKALSETSTGTKQEFFKAMSDFTIEARAAVERLNQATLAVADPRILDFSRLSGDEEFNYQKRVITLYIEAAHNYSEFVSNIMPTLRQRLIAVLGEETEFSQGVIRGLTQKYLAQKPILEPLKQAYIENGQNMMQLLELLQNNKSVWVYENDQIKIHDDDILNEYRVLLQAIGNSEKAVDNLLDKLYGR